MKMTVGASTLLRDHRALIGGRGPHEPAIALVIGVKGQPFYQALACGAKAKAKGAWPCSQNIGSDQFAADMPKYRVVNAIMRRPHRLCRGFYSADEAKALIAPMMKSSRSRNQDRDHRPDDRGHSF